jgi:hypothetical protein
MKKKRIPRNAQDRKLGPKNWKPFELTILPQRPAEHRSHRKGCCEASDGHERERFETANRSGAERRADSGLGFFLTTHGGPQFTARQPH